MEDASADELVGIAISGMTVEHLFKNFGLIRPNNGITYAAMLLFGKHTQRWLPTATVKCVSFIGNSQGGTEFRDKMDDAEADGGLLVQYNAMMFFLKRNLRNVQVDPDFNSLGQLEIPIGALSEICSNALLHRCTALVHAAIHIFKPLILVRYEEIDLCAGSAGKPDGPNHHHR